MNDLLITLWLLLYAVTTLPGWMWVSSAITIIHTVEESEGRIWKVLHVPAWTYFTFQAFVLGLGGVAAFGSFVWLFVTVRLLDVVVTHMILRAPGVYTAPLLAMDAGVILYLTVQNSG